MNIVAAPIIGRRPGIVEKAFTVDDGPKALAALSTSEVVGAYD